MKNIFFVGVLIIFVLSACNSTTSVPTPISIIATLELSPTLSKSPGSLEYSSVAEALASLKTRDDVSIEVSQGWTIITSADGLTIWSFTPPGHPAHPAMAQRIFYQDQGGWFVKMNILCEAEKATCDQFVRDFNALNEQMRQYIEQQHSP